VASSPRAARVAVALLLLLALAASTAPTAAAAPRHPWDAATPQTPTLEVDRDTYICMLLKVVGEVKRVASSYAALSGGTLDPQQLQALHLASLAYARLERGAIELILADDVEEAWGEVRFTLWEGATLLYMAALYGGLEPGSAVVECGGLRVSGPLPALAASLAAAEVRDSRFLVPVTPGIQAGGAGGGDGGDFEAVGNPGAEELFRQEKIGDDVAAGDDAPTPPPRVTPRYSPAETGGAGEGASGLGEVNVEDYLRSLLGFAASGGAGASTAGGGGAGVAAGEPPRFLDAVGRVTLSVDTLLRLAELLSSLEEGGVQPLTGGAAAEPRSTPELAGLWVAAAFAAVSGAAVLALPRLAEARVALERLLRRPQPGREVEMCYSTILRDLAARGLAREPWEAPREFIGRVSRELPPTAVRALSEATSIYERTVYGGYEAGEEEASRCWMLREEVVGAVDGK